MKKIGLVTAYRIDNYGTKLQAYAMQELISLLGCEAEIVDYIPAYDKRPDVVIKKAAAKVKKKAASASDAANKIPENTALLRHKAINSFDSFYKRSGEIHGYANLKKTVENYDGFVCGSDQIWAGGNLITDYFNLKFVGRRRPTVAYAPSFGTSSVPDNMKEKYKSFLSAIDCLSVREESGAKLIKELTGRDADVVADPTILVGREVWDKLAGDIGDGATDYVFCYFLGENPGHRKWAELTAAKYGCKIVILPHMKRFVQADEDLEAEKLYDVSPIRFIELIRDAKFVLTDSFHGTVFSLLYRKEFYTFERFVSGSRESTNTRIYSLLETVNLADRIVTDERQLTFGEIDYASADILLESSRAFSMDYLKGSFEKSGWL